MGKLGFRVQDKSSDLTAEKLVLEFVALVRWRLVLEKEEVEANYKLKMQNSK